MSTTTMIIKCRDCGHEHTSVIQMETSDFQVAEFHEKSEQCPRCESISTYNKSDYFFV